MENIGACSRSQSHELPRDSGQSGDKPRPCSAPVIPHSFAPPPVYAIKLTVGEKNAHDARIATIRSHSTSDTALSSYLDGIYKKSPENFITELRSLVGHMILTVDLELEKTLTPKSKTDLLIRLVLVFNTVQAYCEEKRIDFRRLSSKFSDTYLKILDHFRAGEHHFEISKVEGDEVVKQIMVGVTQNFNKHLEKLPSEDARSLLTIKYIQLLSEGLLYCQKLRIETEDVLTIQTLPIARFVGRESTAIPGGTARNIVNKQDVKTAKIADRTINFDNYHLDSTRSVKPILGRGSNKKVRAGTSNNTQCAILKMTPKSRIEFLEHLAQFYVAQRTSPGLYISSFSYCGKKNKRDVLKLAFEAPVMADLASTMCDPLNDADGSILMHQSVKLVAGFHREGISVNDLKFQNIMVTENGTLLLSDVERIYAPFYYPWTTSGTYDPPEVFEGRERKDKREMTHEQRCQADVWAWAVSILEIALIMQGYAPNYDLLQKPNRTNLSDFHNYAEIVFGPHVELKDLIIRCLSLNPDHRPTMAAVDAELSEE